MDTLLRVTMGSHFIQKCYVTSQNPLVYIRRISLSRSKTICSSAETFNIFESLFLVNLSNLSSCLPELSLFPVWVSLSSALCRYNAHENGCIWRLFILKIVFQNVRLRACPIWRKKHTQLTSAPKGKRPPLWVVSASSVNLAWLMMKQPGRLPWQGERHHQLGQGRWPPWWGSLFPPVCWRPLLTPVLPHLDSAILSLVWLGNLKEKRRSFGPFVTSLSTQLCHKDFPTKATTTVGCG